MSKKGYRRLVIVLVAVCLAGAAVLGGMAWRILSERRESAQAHQAERAALYPGLVTLSPDVTPPPVDLAAPPESEDLSDVPGEYVRLAEEEAASTGSPEPDVTLSPIASPAPTASPTLTPTVAPTPVPQVGRVVQSDVRYTVDFEQLRETNEDIRAWLVQDGTEINYPVVQAKDNAYYLTHLFSGKVNKSGAVFMDCGNSPYLSDMVTWLYAHNRKDDTMFASVPDYMEQDYLDQHPVMYLLTPYEDYQVELFACIRDSLQVEDTWRTRSLDSREDFDAYVAHLREQSAVQSDVQVQWGDQLLAMCTCTNEVHDDRYVVFGVMRPIEYVSDEGLAVTRRELTGSGSLSKTVTIPGRGAVQYYAQNDPVWYRMRYECRTSSQHRPFGQSGCGPTAAAMALANVADDAQLERLLSVSLNGNGFTMCSCSVNQYFCNKKHVQFKAQTADDLRAYLPVVMASFATGNNLWGVKSRGDGGGTSTAFMEKVCEACSLDFRATRDMDEVLDALSRGGAAVFSSGGSVSPYTGAGHYLTLIWADDDYFYILDPYYKEDYSRTDRHHVLEVLEPGVLRARREDERYLLMYAFYLFIPRVG